MFRFRSVSAGGCFFVGGVGAWRFDVVDGVSVTEVCLGVFTVELLAAIQMVELVAVEGWRLRSSCVLVR